MKRNIKKTRIITVRVEDYLLNKLNLLSDGGKSKSRVVRDILEIAIDNNTIEDLSKLNNIYVYPAKILKVVDRKPIVD